MPTVQPDVCYVDAQGQLICGTSLATTTISADSVSQIHAALGDVSDTRFQLILSLISEVLASPVSDTCIDTRSGDIAASVHDLLQSPTPVMLLYRYVALPGNVMAAYYVQQNQFGGARQALDQWSSLKPGC